MIKKLIVCCDGTWNVPDKMDGGDVHPSNVAKLALSVATQSVYGALNPVVEAVLTDRNANISALLSQANSVAQQAISNGG